MSEGITVDRSIIEKKNEYLAGLNECRSNEEVRGFLRVQLEDLEFGLNEMGVGRGLRALYDAQTEWLETEEWTS
jgi:hypothetical protein